MEIQRERYRRIRGTILKLLANQHPGVVDLRVLRYLLDDLRLSMTEKEFESHVFYLSQKGLIYVERRKTSGIEIEMASISPRGLDVLDGFVHEEGINTDL